MANKSYLQKNWEPTRYSLKSPLVNQTKSNNQHDLWKNKGGSAQTMTAILLMYYPALLVVGALALSAWANHLKTKMLKT
jgi:hypothetical protein